MGQDQDRSTNHEKTAGEGNKGKCGAANDDEGTGGAVIAVGGGNWNENWVRAQSNNAHAHFLALKSARAGGTYFRTGAQSPLQ